MCGAKMCRGLAEEEAPQQWARVDTQAKKAPLLPEAVAYLAPEILNGTKYPLAERVDLYVSLFL